MSRTKAEIERLMMALLAEQNEPLEKLLAQRWIEDIACEVERLERVTISYATQPGFSLVH